MNEETTVVEPTELDALKERADLLGISYHPSIGLDKLREKVNAAVTSEGDGKTEDEGKASNMSETSTRSQKRKDAAELVRVRITCMNPNKREWEGELFTAGNRVVGTFKKMVPFDVEWHVPRIILNMIQSRKCQVFHTVTDGRGNKTRKGKLIKEYSVEVLPSLTEKELKELAQRQAMARGTADAV